MHYRLIEVVFLAVVLAPMPMTAGGQSQSSSPVTLPSSVSLSDVQIQLTTGGGDGCLGRCTAWRIVLRGEGVVELHDLGTPPTAEAKRRAIGSDTIPDLVNAFLQARFFHVLGDYEAVGSAVRSGDSLLLFGAVSGTEPWTELTLRLGPATKTIRLHENIPAELRALRDRVWQIGGPAAWAAK
jgi:hypothetical protein